MTPEELERTLTAMAASGCDRCPSWDSCRSVLRGGGCACVPSAPEDGTGGFLGRILRKSRRLLPWFLAFALLPSVVHADVDCWYDSASGGWVCAGGGGYIHVAGPGDSVMDYEDVLGVCTNCLAMSPADMADWKSRAFDLTRSLSDNIYWATEYANVVRSALEYLIHDNDGLQYVPSPSFSNAETNKFATYVSPYSYTLVYEATRSATTSAGRVWPPKGAMQCGHANNTWNGALAYSHQIEPHLETQLYGVNELTNRLAQIDSATSALDYAIYGLTEEPCTNGLGQVTNPTNENGNVALGNWCTYEQGESIISALNDIKSFVDDSRNYLSAVSSGVYRVENTLRNALFSDYTHIPAEADLGLGKTWQDVYLDGASTSWGYDPTNILQRIELLVYGISGVGTNGVPAAAFDPDTTPDPDETADGWQEATSDFSTDASSADVQTFGSALVGFFQAFSGASGNQLASSDVFVPEIPVRLGEETLTIPAYQAEGDSVRLFNGIAGVCRAFCIALYLLGGAFLVFRYWVWFASWAVKFTKWAQEIVTSLFAG